MASVTPSPTPTPIPIPATPAVPRWIGLAVAAQFLMLAVALIGGGLYLYHVQHPAPVVKPFDATFVPVGRQYADALATSYASAWDQAADDLDSGKPFADTTANLGKAWNASRTQMFDQALTPALSKIIPESTAEPNITATQRQSMAKAFRGLAQGLRK